jgi:hypothetical protein
MAGASNVTHMVGAHMAGALMAGAHMTGASHVTHTHRGHRLNLFYSCYTENLTTNLTSTKLKFKSIKKLSGWLRVK